MNKTFHKMSILYKEESNIFFAENIGDFKVLIITATDTEKRALHQYLKPIEGRDALIQVAIGKQTYFLGVFGSYYAAHVACGEMGSTGRNASIITTKDAIIACNPSIVLMVGIAFGKDEKQEIGDALVAERVVPYEPQRVGKKNTIARGKEGPASSMLVNRFGNAGSWHHALAKRNAEVIIGDVLTGEKLIDNPTLKKKLLKSHPNAKGGEMEGGGIYAACDGYNLEWVLVKGICDYGDGNKKENKEEYQAIAIQSALSLCEHVFMAKHAFESIGVYSIEEAKKKDSTANLKRQVDRQLKKQLNSEKYVPSTFIETGSQKDHIRYLCDSIFYAKKCSKEINNLDFRHLNSVLQRRGKGQFSWSTDLFETTTDTLTVQNYSAAATAWHRYLLDKKEELDSIKISSYEKYKFQQKIIDSIQTVEYLQAKVSIITDNAGQGKTNFLCDFVDNFLNKRNIPTLFLTGAEVDANDIRKSILQKTFPDSTDNIFKDFLNSVKSVCYTQKKFFIIIIDGINENLNTKVFSQKLEEFISEMVEYDFIKILLTCRSEYYQHNFTNLDNSSFRPTIKKIDSLIGKRFDDHIKNKLLHTYFRHYEIKYTSLAEKARRQLADNFLLLRIFCEAHKGQALTNINDIYKHELFDKYYTLKSAEVNKKLKQADEFNVSSNLDIKKFIHSVITFMITKRKYANIPLDDIISAAKERDVYIRFLDENILIRRDIDTEEQNLFGPSEVVNFTFDEFRDFLISNYLVSVLYKASETEFSSFLKNELTDKSPIHEGCSTFLFFTARRHNDKELARIISQQPWFDHTFSKNIFSLQDTLVLEEDKQRIIRQLLTGPQLSESIIWNLIIRNDIKYYTNLNSDFLFSFLRSLDDNQYAKSFIRQFSSQDYSFSRINQSRLIEQIDDLLDKVDSGENGRYHKLFELLLYMFLNESNWKIKSIYEQYSYRNPKQCIPQIREALKSKNPLLVHSINSFVRQHEIRI